MRPGIGTVRVRIDALAAGGDGVGRQLDGAEAGRAIFVPRVVPGDVLEVRLVERHRRWARGEALRWIHRGSGRIDAPCPQVDRCGGCPWQHVAPPLRDHWRIHIVRNALRRLPDVPIAALDAQTTPRCRVRWHVGQDARGRVAAGYRARRSHRLVTVPPCPVLHPDLLALADVLPDALADVPDRTTGSIAALAGDEGTALSVRLQAALVDPEPIAQRLVTANDRVVGVQVETGRGRATAGEPVVCWTLPGADRQVRVRLPAAGFAQPSPGAAAALAARVLHIAAPVRGTWLDLFSGAGTLSLPLATAVDRVVAVEREGPAFDALRALARAPRWRGRLRAVGCDLRAREATTRLLDEHRPRGVVLDPPREGARAACEALATHPVAHLVYVSCNPATFGRDAELLARAGYRLRRVDVVDVAPGTAHIETVAHFRYDALAFPPRAGPS